MMEDTNLTEPQLIFKIQNAIFHSLSEDKIKEFLKIWNENHVVKNATSSHIQYRRVSDNFVFSQKHLFRQMNNFKMDI